jgi:hypothetical protein
LFIFSIKLIPESNNELGSFLPTQFSKGQFVNLVLFIHQYELLTLALQGSDTPGSA